VKRTIEEINEKIRKGRAVILTAEEMVALVKERGIKAASQKVDVVTTATFGPMCSSGVFLNFGHSDPPMKLQKVYLNGVMAYGGIAAVDVYLGATEPSLNQGYNYGGAQVIEDLIKGKRIHLKATALPTDCYPRSEIDTFVTLEKINQAIMVNPRNVYQNYAVAVNTSEKVLYTYMGTLLPRLGNANYSTSGQLSPLLKDPEYRTIGIGTRIFLGGTIGYVAWEGTQHNPQVPRDKKTKIPYTPAATLCLIGDLKQMNRNFLRAATFYNYGPTLYVGVGIPIPILDEDLARSTGVGDEEIYATVFDYGVGRRSRPQLGKVTYAELRSGRIKIGGKIVPTAPLSSYTRAREIAATLKEWIKEKKFYLTGSLQALPKDRVFRPLVEDWD